MRVATLDDFTADAFQGDMGMTTPMRPTELPNPDGLVDDERAGVDLPIERVDRIAFYLRRIAIPKRVGLTARGAQLFERHGLRDLSRADDADASRLSDRAARRYRRADLHRPACCTTRRSARRRQHRRQRELRPVANLAADRACAS